MIMVCYTNALPSGWKVPDSIGVFGLFCAFCSPLDRADQTQFTKTLIYELIVRAKRELTLKNHPRELAQ